MPYGNTSHISGFSEISPCCKNCRHSEKIKNTAGRGHLYVCQLGENLKPGNIVGNGTRQLLHPVRVAATDYCPGHCWDK